jgi:hypothetical protein
MVDTTASTELVDDLPGLFKRPGMPNDIAKAAWFFASELSAYVRAVRHWIADGCLPS